MSAPVSVDVFSIERDPSAVGTMPTTLNLARGIDEHGNVVVFMVEWRAARDISEAMRSNGGRAPAVVESWQVVRSSPAFMVVE